MHGFAFALMIGTFREDVIDTPTYIAWVALPWLTCAAACDIIIGVAQVVYLYRRRTGLPGTTRLLNVLSLYIISTGMLTSIVAIVDLIVVGIPNLVQCPQKTIDRGRQSVIFGTSAIQIFLCMIMGAFYGVSFLANLDARRVMRDMDKRDMEQVHVANLATNSLRVSGIRNSTKASALVFKSSATTNFSIMDGHSEHSEEGEKTESIASSRLQESLTPAGTDDRDVV
ncbi:hypothetical protein DXG01_005275 [Tephrocybe rancida]|nr:hypothetical protein DXG01_005275 [Tephrocybe rancida]